MTNLNKTKYQWLYTGADKHEYLHFIEAVSAWDETFFDAYDTQFDGERPWAAACGLTALFAPPGVASRLGAPRCDACCEKIGIPSGEGCPVNDRNLNP